MIKGYRAARLIFKKVYIVFHLRQKSHVMTELALVPFTSGSKRPAPLVLLLLSDSD